MNREEILEEYGDVEMQFHSYYKFVFEFTATAEDGVEIYASLGGDSDSIYKRHINLKQPKKLKNLFPNYVTVTKNNKEIGWYEKEL